MRPRPGTGGGSKIGLYVVGSVAQALGGTAGARVAGGRLVLRLTLLQVLFGVANVYLAVPVWLSALHLATATAILAASLTLAFQVARGRVPDARPVGAR